jgi:TRAP-type uncharacterized transport system substrate-binding protein
MRKILATFWLIGLFMLSACDSGPHELRFVTPALSIDREIVEDMAALFDGESSVHIALTDSPLAGEAALAAIASGDADIALVSNNLPFRNDIATIMPLYPTVLHIAQRGRNTALAGAEMLRDATVFAGTEGSASRLTFERIVKRIGLKEGDYRYVSDPEDGSSGLAVEPDVVILFAPISPDRVAKLAGFVLSSIGDPNEIGSGGVLDAAVMLNPHFRPFVIPVGTYGDATPGPIVTVAVDKILVARDDLDSTIVYDLISEILRHRPALAAQRPGLFRQLSDEIDTSQSTFIVHAGTQAYLQRDEPTIYERYSGIAEVVVSAIVAFGSALYATSRILRLRRKNRIDKFYTKTIALRRSVNESTGQEELQKVIDEVRRLQSDAFDLLVDEKLAADESFRIFITLSNDVLQQLGEKL